METIVFPVHILFTKEKAVDCPVLVNCILRLH